MGKPVDRDENEEENDDVFDEEDEDEGDDVIGMSLNMFISVVFCITINLFSWV